MQRYSEKLRPDIRHSYLRLGFLNDLYILIKVINLVPSNPLLSLIPWCEDLIIKPKDNTFSPSKFYLPDIDVLNAINGVYFADEKLAASLKQYRILLILHRRIITNNRLYLSALNRIYVKPQIAVIIVILFLYFLFFIVDFDSRYNILELEYFSRCVVILFILA